MGCFSQGEAAEGRKDPATVEGLHLEAGRTKKTKVLTRGFQQLPCPEDISASQIEPVPSFLSLLPSPFFLAPPSQWKEEREGKGRTQRRWAITHLFLSAGIQPAIAPNWQEKEHTTLNKF